jgi:hypothetical protein
MDINHMAPFQINLDEYAYMSDPAGDGKFPDHANARSAYATLCPTPRPTATDPKAQDPPEMPPGGPYWSPEQLQLYDQWMKDGFAP